MDDFLKPFKRFFLFLFFSIKDGALALILKEQSKQYIDGQFDHNNITKQEKVRSGG